MKEDSLNTKTDILEIFRKSTGLFKSEKAKESFYKVFSKLDNETLDEIKTLLNRG